MDQVQQRLASVLSVTRFQETKATDVTLYTKLPVQHFDPTQFNQFDKIYQSSCRVAHWIVTQWDKEGFASGRVKFSSSALADDNNHNNNHGRWQDKGLDITSVLQSKNRRNSV